MTDTHERSENPNAITEQQDNGWTRIDEDPNAETGDTRIRTEPGENGTYVLKREEYGLVEFETESESDGDPFERYDWHTDDKFVLYGDSEAEQFAQMLRKDGAFDPDVLFFRQRNPGGESESNAD